MGKLREIALKKWLETQGRSSGDVLTDEEGLLFINVKESISKEVDGVKIVEDEKISRLYLPEYLQTVKVKNPQ